MRINRERLLEDIHRYGQYGADPDGGITRPSFSEADLQVRNLLVRQLRSMGMLVETDAVGNIWGTYPGTGRKAGSIVVGSHLDTVPNGGKWDGALGVLLAKELAATLQEHGIRLDHDLEVVSFTGEESSEYGTSTLGSRVFTGLLTAEDLMDLRDSQGHRLVDAIASVGGDCSLFHSFARQRQRKKAFLELHIEQGRRLEERGLSVGIVDRVAGIFRSQVTVIGEANHSGTTVMTGRHDALVAASEMVLAVNRVSAGYSETVGTVGKLRVFPNAVNVIPGRVEFVVEIRTPVRGALEGVRAQLRSEWLDICHRHGTAMEEKVLLNEAPVEFDADVIRALQASADALQEPYMMLTSMAVHDAGHMSRISQAGMVFVRSIGGKSHCPEEDCLPEDIERAGNVLLHAVLAIDHAIE
ncbi:MAG: Zn-dependent hydrolase [Alicyclobacillus sp.]|nr:Zn-dependent hydrolase [Alicyclobacillus sp.]